jgi:nuclear pore complex protein Nup155
METLRRAKDTSDDADLQRSLLRETLRLFEKTASTLSLENVREAADEFSNLQFFSGAVELAIVVAKESDRGNLALRYLAEGKPQGVSGAY